jgi:hypothetical protein
MHSRQRCSPHRQYPGCPLLRLQQLETTRIFLRWILDPAITETFKIMVIDGFNWLHATGATPPHHPAPGDPCRHAPAHPFEFEAFFLPMSSRTFSSTRKTQTRLVTGSARERQCGPNSSRATALPSCLTHICVTIPRFRTFWVFTVRRTKANPPPVPGWAGELAHTLERSGT